MTRLLELLVSLLIVAALVVLVGVLLPSHGHLERSVDVPNPIRQIYDSLNTMRRFLDWSPERRLDPLVTMKYSGERLGPGASVEWSGNQSVGKGSLTIASSIEDEQVKMDLDNDFAGVNKTYTIDLVPAENGKPIEQNSNPFPAFEGKDLDGNTVKSDELFSANAVTVVNFWFTTCNPCVGELSELDALNKELAKKGGALIGVNTFTLDGDEAAISEAKDVLAKKGVTYQNVYFASDGEAGKFTTNIFAYPTTYVVDRNGNIVGDPIVGAITEKKQAETLQKLIDQALAADMG